MADNGLKGWIKRRIDNARQGIEENLAWLVVVLVAGAAWVWLRDGDVPAWVLGVAVLIAAIILATVATALLRHIDRLGGQLTEARRGREEALQRVAELERRAAGATDTDQPSAPEARELVRRIRALRESLDRTGSNLTSGAETAHLTAIIRDLEDLVGSDNSAVQEARTHWIERSSEHYRDSATVTLDQLEAVAHEYRKPPNDSGSADTRLGT